MYLAGFSIDNLSLMALTISTGFVVDDAIVVIENITRYLEHGMHPFQAALKGAQEIGFTVLTISISLIAVFIPLLMMGGIVGRLFREFAITLSVAILVSMVISLTTTPMMCAHLLQTGAAARTDVPQKRSVVHLDREPVWARRCPRCCGIPRITLLSLLATIALTVYLYIHVPKGFFPQQDTGRLMGQIQADQDTSFQTMDKTLLQMVNIVEADPAVDTVNGILGRRRRHHDQHGADVHLAEAARRTKCQRRPDHRSACVRSWRSARRDALSAGRAGPARRRPAEQRAISIHHARRQSARI